MTPILILGWQCEGSFVGGPPHRPRIPIVEALVVRPHGFFRICGDRENTYLSSALVL